jgi:hypothetical protein
MGWGCEPNAQPPAWRTRVSLWNLTLDLSGMGDPVTSYATASIALEVMGSHKPSRHDKAETPSWVIRPSQFYNSYQSDDN